MHDTSRTLLFLLHAQCYSTDKWDRGLTSHPKTAWDSNVSRNCSGEGEGGGATYVPDFQV